MNVLLGLGLGVLALTAFFYLCNKFLMARDARLEEDARSILMTTSPAAAFTITSQMFRWMQAPGDPKSDQSVVECAICLTELEEAIVRVLPSCNHVFHRSCIDLWLSCNTTCPICRRDLVANHRS
ncbi:E3 ubiquitin-protein ligase EL5 [Selaginella moellendorffii]|nr:E3 ubiquitin-protein ligase EL5 [Selaginella moellendorffii]|eukprot:XP_002974287.2 E3 ubiquitin-protein ligase EL5 [Selaginella moellendorffii]